MRPLPLLRAAALAVQHRRTGEVLTQTLTLTLTLTLILTLTLTLAVQHRRTGEVRARSGRGRGSGRGQGLGSGFGFGFAAGLGLRSAARVDQLVLLGRSSDLGRDQVAPSDSRWGSVRPSRTQSCRVDATAFGHPGTTTPSTGLSGSTHSTVGGCKGRCQGGGR